MFLGWAMPKWLTLVISWRLKKKPPFIKTEYINCLPTLFKGLGRTPKIYRCFDLVRKKKTAVKQKRRLIQGRGDLLWTQHPIKFQKTKSKKFPLKEKKQANSIHNICQESVKFFTKSHSKISTKPYESHTKIMSDASTIPPLHPGVPPFAPQPWRWQLATWINGLPGGRDKIPQSCEVSGEFRHWFFIYFPWNEKMTPYLKGDTFS